MKPPAAAAAGRSLWQRLRGWWSRRRAAVPAPAAAAAPRSLEWRACTTVVIPALNEAARIAQVVAHARDDPATAEVIVVDDSSTDDTAALARAAGARVITSTLLGKGASMRDGLEVADQEFVVYLDGDLTGLKPGLVGDLVRPLAADEADFVKARFGRGGGRVTELTAKPMLQVFFPELAHLAQPLGGIIAARRSLLQPLDFEDGYGVDVGLLIDACLRGARLAEVDIGRIEHDSQPLPDLAAMANEVARVIYARSRVAGRLHVEQISAMYEAQRHAMASIDTLLGRRRGRDRLLLLTMEGTVTPESFVHVLARRSGHAGALEALLARDDDPALRATRIAALFRFVHRYSFEQTARSLQLRTGVVEWVNLMRRAGFMVGVVSDGCFVAAEVVRRRVFADFALAHTLHFRNEVCTGELSLNPAFFEPVATGALPPAAGPCKSHVLRHLLDDAGTRTFASVWVVGSRCADLELLRRADRRLLVDPERALRLALPDTVADADFQRLAQRLERDGVAGDAFSPAPTGTPAAASA